MWPVASGRQLPDANQLLASYRLRVSWPAIERAVIRRKLRLKEAQPPLGHQWAGSFASTNNNWTWYMTWVFTGQMADQVFLVGDSGGGIRPGGWHGANSAGSGEQSGSRLYLGLCLGKVHPRPA